jgi:hypothetical protein
MATPLHNIVAPRLCVRPPEHRDKMSSLGARRMLTKLGELHQPLHPRPVKNPGAAWAVHALTGFVSRGLIWCWRSLCCTGRGRKQSWFHLGSCESTLAKDGTPQETFWGEDRGCCVAASIPLAVEISWYVPKLEESLRRTSSVYVAPLAPRKVDQDL